jgi:hypothetical protein
MFKHFFDANLPFAGLVNSTGPCPCTGLPPLVRFGKRAALVSYPKGECNLWLRINVCVDILSSLINSMLCVVKLSLDPLPSPPLLRSNLAATTDDPQTGADHTASAAMRKSSGRQAEAQRPLGGRYRHCTKPIVDSDLSRATSRRSSMILQGEPL